MERGVLGLESYQYLESPFPVEPPPSPPVGAHENGGNGTSVPAPAAFEAPELVAARMEAEAIRKGVRDEADRIVATAREEAGAVLSAAQEEAVATKGRGEVQAREITAAASSDADKLRQAAREEGLRTGLEQGKALGRTEALEALRQEFEGRIQQFEAILTSAQEERRKVLAGIESEVVALALAVARKVLVDELRTNPEVVVAVARQAISRASVRETLTVRVNPADAEVIRSHRPDLMTSAEGIRTLEVAEDPRVMPGGCVIETATGTVEARIERQIDEITKALSGNGG